MHELPESVVLDKVPQFAAELTKEFNSMLEIETKLLIAFHSQTNGQTERMNQELEQYLRFFVDHRQKDWPKWLILTEFIINNKAYSAIKVSLFMANYGRELKMGMYIRRKEKMEKITEFADKENTRESRCGTKGSTRRNKVTSRQGGKEVKEWKVRNKMMLSMKDSIFKE